MATRKSILDIKAFKGRTDTKMVCLTAYAAPMARRADRHADLLLVGDSLGMVLYGLPSTLGVTLDMMVAHGRTVVLHSSEALVVVDLPFGSYQESPAQAFGSAARLMMETGCAAVKLEGGVEMAETVDFLVQRGIPVMGHIGLKPQSFNQAGGYKVTGRTDEDAARLLADAKALEDAGVFSMVLEGMDSDTASMITRQVSVPTVGIGAGAACDGQILVTDDLLGISFAPRPKFAKAYAELGAAADEAFAAYAQEVREGAFPSASHSYARSGDKGVKRRA